MAFNKPAAIALGGQWMVPLLLLGVAAQAASPRELGGILVLAATAAYCWVRVMRLLWQCAPDGPSLTDRVFIGVVLAAQVSFLGFVVLEARSADHVTLALYAGASPLVLVPAVALAVALRSRDERAGGTR